MENSNIGNLMETTMTRLKEIVDVDTVVGTPVTTPDGVTIIPVSRVSYAFASGGVDTLYLFPADSNGNVRHYSFDFSPSETVGGSSARLRLYWALHSNLWESDSSVVVNIGQMPTMSIDRIVIRAIADTTYGQKAAPTVGEKERSRSPDVTIGVRRKDMRQKNEVEYAVHDYHKIIRIPDNGPVR